MSEGRPDCHLALVVRHLAEKIEQTLQTYSPSLLAPLLIGEIRVDDELAADSFRVVRQSPSLSELQATVVVPAIRPSVPLTPDFMADGLERDVKKN
jgi:hypothetical protein